MAVNGRGRIVNDRPADPGRDYVLYWMIAARRPAWNFALDRAIDGAQSLGKPLVILEALEADYPWASDRLHRFVIDGMRDNTAAFREAPVTYFPYVEPAPGDGRGLLEALGRHACLVVTDDFPCFFLPRIVNAAGRRLDVRVEAVDSNGLMPLAAADHAFTTAASYRRWMQKTLPGHLRQLPRARPFDAARLGRLPSLPRHVMERWTPVSEALLNGDAGALAALPIDHGVPIVEMRGGRRAAEDALQRFVTDRLPRYAERHNAAESDGTSRLSPYLHFGHLSAHQIFDAVMGREQWSLRTVANKPATGARDGWWGVSASAEAYLDQLVVWRELGYNMCAQRPHDYDQYASLPDWARQSLSAHLTDRRSPVYDLDTLERGATHDPLWNAAQGQMRREGWFHNYMRMLWGKKILEWSPTPQDALDRMIAIMNRWSLDGRNPNSYSGYFWTLGRYDRPWPERPVFGVIRYMSSASTAKKMSVKNYIAAYAPASTPQSGLPL